METDPSLLNRKENKMKPIPKIIDAAIRSFFIVLFIYAAVSKMSDFETFQVQLAQSPLFGNCSPLVSYATIGVELGTVLLLSVRRCHMTGLYASLGIMSAFAAYIYVILKYSDSVPCACGGILENMDWNTHLVFNLFCALLAIVAIAARTTKEQRQTAMLVIGSVVLPIAGVIVLYYPHRNDNQGTFTRIMMTPLAEERKTLPLPRGNYYFAGRHGDSVFLANHRTPLLLTTVLPGFNSLKTDTIRLNNYNYEFVSVTVNVHYPYFTVSDGKVPVIFEGRMPSLKAYDAGINRLYFSRLYLLGPQRYVFKTMLVKTKQSELGILNTASQKYWINPDVLPASSEGVFGSDGSISIDFESQHILYTHLYRSEIITTDFDLRHIRRKNTIDSLSGTEMETQTLQNGQTKLLRAPVEINRHQSIAGSRLYNVSKMRGKNESYGDFRRNDVIDVYDALTQQYRYSFYLKNEKRIKIRGILATPSYLYVLSENTLTRYRFK